MAGSCDHPIVESGRLPPIEPLKMLRLLATVVLYLILVIRTFAYSDSGLKSQKDELYGEKVDSDMSKGRTTKEVFNRMPYRFRRNDFQLFSDAVRRSPEKSTQEVFKQGHIRFGGRSDITPLEGKMIRYKGILDELINRESRSPSSNNNHIRFGRSDPNVRRVDSENTRLRQVNLSSRRTNDDDFVRSSNEDSGFDSDGNFLGYGRGMDGEWNAQNLSGKEY